VNGEENRPSPDTTLAVILGVSKCSRSPHLANLPASENSAGAFYHYLTGEFGMPEENVKELFDSRKSPGSQILEIGEWLCSRKEMLKDLIVFYTGHGGFTPGDRKFFLATRFTTERSEGATSIRIVDLANELKDKAWWARKYLIFDCCFAGSVVAEFMASPGLVAVNKTKEVFPSKGTAVLCSSSSQEVSIAPLGGQYTRFSDALFGILQDGNKRVPTDLSLHDVGMQIRERILEKYPEGGMRPEIHSPDQTEGDVASVHLFPNVALRSFPASQRSYVTADGFTEAEAEANRRLEAESRQKEDQERLAIERRKTAAKERLEPKRDEGKEKESLEAEQRQRQKKEQLEKEPRKREKKKQLEAEQRQSEKKEQLEKERHEREKKKRLEAERRERKEKERLEAEQRQREWEEQVERYFNVKDYAKALPLLYKAAGAGNASAMFKLGCLYHTGGGVGRDYAKAREWYQRAANAGSAVAMYNLGVLYATGRGIGRDYAKAREWYQKGADAGNRDAMNNLGALYHLPLIHLYRKGAVRDYAKAREWYQKAADAGSAIAMYNMGRLYQHGWGVDRDRVKAREWYQKGADAGNAAAKEALSSLE
jgi:TPR repeat protein